MTFSPEQNSPCTGVCIIDIETGLCEGCLRTADEIGDWADKSSEEIQETLKRIEERKKR